MGLYKDEVKLQADNYYEQNDRMFKTSRIMPFAGNMAFVLHHVAFDDTYKIQFLVQEFPQILPFCGSSVCDYDLFKEHFKEELSYDFDEMCKSDTFSKEDIHYEL